MSVKTRIAVGILPMAFVAWFVFTPVDAGAPSDTGGVEVRAIKYRDLVQAVRSQRGKVVVIDVWADFCTPCKKEFHNLVEMHQRDGTKGLVCMSVAVDPPKDKKAPAPPPGTLAFLIRQKAAFANYWLNEDAKVWTERWGITGPPAVFVFDRQGRRAAKFDREDPDKSWEYDDVKKLVQKLLAQSP